MGEESCEIEIINQSTQHSIRTMKLDDFKSLGYTKSSVDGNTINLLWGDNWQTNRSECDLVLVSKIDDVFVLTIYEKGELQLSDVFDTIENVIEIISIILNKQK